jgi:transposase-like protein
MNTHKHARLTFARRLEMVKQMTLQGWDAVRAAALHGVAAPTARKWLGRYLAGGEAALVDASSRPIRSPRTIDASKALLIVELRKRRMLQARIARSVGVSESTVSRVLARAGMSKLSDLDPAEAIVRYEHKAPGDLLHIDTKKLGRIVRPSHRVTGNRRDSVDGAAGRRCSWPSMTTPGWRSPPCILTRSRHRQSCSCAMQWPITLAWASPCSDC